MKIIIKLIIGIVLLLNYTQAIGQEKEISNNDNRFPFEYNKRKKTPKVSKIWIKVYQDLKSSFTNKNKLIILHGYSSAIGKKKYNYKLSKDRALAVKTFLVKKGIDKSRIKIEPHGEPNAKDYGNDDYAGDREVLPVFKNIAIQKPIDYIDQFRNKENLDDDIKDGHKIFLNIIGPYVTYIKERYHLQDSGPGRPSKDVNKFLKQTKEVFDDAKGAYGDAISGDYKNLAEVIGKYGAASFIDLFTSLQAGKVAKDRKPLYDAIGEAFATECFTDYEASIDDFTIGQKFLFYSVKFEVGRLSNFEKYKLRVRFIAGKTYTLSTFPRSDRFERSMDDYSMFVANIRHYFAQSDTRYKD